MIALVFALGRRVHSTRTGLIAAAMSRCGTQRLRSVATSQETLYLPLILTAFLLLARAIDRDDLAPGFVLAGFVFGAAALTRSMPLFFALPAACVHVALARNRRRASAQALAFLVGFMLLTVPYSAALSRHFGQLTIIDTHGSIHLESPSGARAPSLLETATDLWHSIAARPVEYFTSASRARIAPPRQWRPDPPVYVVAGSKANAVAWKTLVHLGSDGLLIFATVLAGLGAALCRQSRIAVLFLLWPRSTLSLPASADSAAPGSGRRSSPSLSSWPPS